MLPKLGIFMDLLGEVETVTNDGKLVVRANTDPEINVQVFDAKGRKVGTVKRIFGPVDEPYVTVVPFSKENVNGLLNKRIYFTGEKRDGKNITTPNITGISVFRETLAIPFETSEQTKS